MNRVIERQLLVLPVSSTTVSLVTPWETSRETEIEIYNLFVSCLSHLSQETDRRTEVEKFTSSSINSHIFCPETDREIWTGFIYLSCYSTRDKLGNRNREICYFSLTSILASKRQMEIDMPTSSCLTPPLYSPESDRKPELRIFASSSLTHFSEWEKKEREKEIWSRSEKGLRKQVKGFKRARKIDRQTDTHTDRQIDRRTDRQIRVTEKVRERERKVAKLLPAPS